MDKKFKQSFLLITYAILLFVAVNKVSSIFAFLKNLVGLLSPLVVGLIIAFMLNVPMRGFERLLEKLALKINKNRVPSKTAITCISFLLTLLCVALVIALVVTMMIPGLVGSLENLYAQTMEKWPEWSKILNDYGFKTDSITDWLESLGENGLLSSLQINAGSVISSAATFAMDAVSGITSFIISVIIAGYALLSKRQLANQANRLMSAYLKKSTAERLRSTGQLISDTYSKFLSGQCVEACILGILIFTVFMILGIPYAGLTAVLAAVFAFVPYVGSFVACFIGAFFVLLVDPSKVLLCIIVYIVVQFIENQFIYPHVVGTSVGLGAFWTLVAVVLGGQIMGVMGMIFFIPLFSVFVNLLRRHAVKTVKLKERAKVKLRQATEPHDE